MSRKLCVLLVTLLAGGLIAVGCGDDDDDGGGGSDEPSQEQSGGGGDSGGAPTPENVEQAVEQCEQQIQSAPQLSDDAKKDLENVCKDAASGDEEAVREASEKVCKTVLEESGVSGAAAEQAKAACENVNP